MVCTQCKYFRLTKMETWVYSGQTWKSGFAMVLANPLLNLHTVYRLVGSFCQFDSFDQRKPLMDIWLNLKTSLSCVENLARIADTVKSDNALGSLFQDIPFRVRFRKRFRREVFYKTEQCVCPIF